MPAKKFPTTPFLKWIESFCGHLPSILDKAYKSFTKSEEQKERSRTNPATLFVLTYIMLNELWKGSSLKVGIHIEKQCRTRRTKQAGLSPDFYTPY